ncbi:hypothetical protein [Streptomyces sp. NPDC005989]|uniref:hypothetical protein n=1 Tax=Streptomyces sp. NPDC005989 TaxID=3156727 RepID=UPI0033E25A52
MSMRWAAVAGANHFAFTDLAPLAGQLGADDPKGLPGKRATEITRDYMGAFFDKQLRGKDVRVFSGMPAYHQWPAHPVSLGEVPRAAPAP